MTSKSTSQAAARKPAVSPDLSEFLHMLAALETQFTPPRPQR